MESFTASCGHSAPYPRGCTRWSKKRWNAYAARPCLACYRLEQARETLTASRRLGLRILSGTDRQVAWAYAIRYGAIWKAAHHATGYGGVDTLRDSALLRELVAAANTRATAGQWIALRYHGAEALLADCGYIEELSTLPLGETLPEAGTYATAPF